MKLLIIKPRGIIIYWWKKVWVDEPFIYNPKESYIWTARYIFRWKSPGGKWKLTFEEI